MKWISKSFSHQDYACDYLSTLSDEELVKIIVIGRHNEVIVMYPSVE